MTITSTAPVLSSAGISAPAYSDILVYLQAQYQGIYGSDVYLGNDSQDGQFLAVIATSINDANSVAIAVYNSFSPANAQGNSLSSNVKLNGMTRKVASYSTATLSLVGTAGVAITNGIVQDAAKNNWVLPASVTFSSGGTASVTATCATLGAVAAIPGSINQIITPQLGWVSATNAAAAVPGAPVETDPALQQRQVVSVAPASQTPLFSTVGAVAGVAGVTSVTGYENPLGTPDANGLPAHSISLVVEGGGTTDIATAIANRKTQGAATYGTTSATVPNSYGIPETINFFIATQERIIINLNLHAINGYTAAIGVEIQNALATYVNGLGTGANVIYGRLWAPAGLTGNPDGLSYEIDALTVAIYGNTPGTVDVPILFNQAATLAPSDVTITLV
jgi:uncharacterized phage protein gp47/JayE